MISVLSKPLRYVAAWPQRPCAMAATYWASSEVGVAVAAAPPWRWTFAALLRRAVTARLPATLCRRWTSATRAGGAARGVAAPRTALTWVGSVRNGKLRLSVDESAEDVGPLPRLSPAFSLARPSGTSSADFSTNYQHQPDWSACLGPARRSKGQFPWPVWARGGAGEIRTRERGTPVTAFPVRTPERPHFASNR